MYRIERGKVVLKASHRYSAAIVAGWLYQATRICVLCGAWERRN